MDQVKAWQPKQIWTRTFICAYRNVPTSDSRVIGPDAIISRRRLPVPVFAVFPHVIGRVTFLNESDDGSFWADVELNRDPSKLESGLYPQMDLGVGSWVTVEEHSVWSPEPEVTRVLKGEVDFTALHLGHRPAWPTLQPIT